MKKIYTLALSLAMMATTSVALADGIHVGYCEGILSTDGMGLSGTNATISGAINITGEMLSPYASCQITSLYVGLTEGAAAYPEEVTAWLRTEKEGENIVSGTLAVTDGGWLTIQLDAPVNVADYTETGIWAGYDYVQAKKYNILGIGGTTGIEDGCWVAKNGKWSNYNKYGVLPIEAIVEGEGLPQYDLKLMEVAAKPNVVKLGTEIVLKGTVKNNALQTAVNPILRATYEDKEYTQVLETELAYRDAYDFVANIELDPADLVEREMDINVEILWDGQDDDYAADNVGSTHVSLVKDVYYRKMVVEEGTGAWCGWCVRGIVGLRQMRAKYPEQFIGLGVHNGDDYVVAAYDSWMRGFISGFPSCLINRDGKVYDPNTQELENYLLSMDPIASVGLDIEANYADGQLEINTTINTLVSGDVNYRLVHVVVEDQLPIQQKNYYSGGGSGPMDGFEDMPSTCDILLDDIVRGVYPSPAGVDGSVPAQLVKGEPAVCTTTVDMCDYADAQNVAIVALLIDAKTGEIVNGEKTEKIYGLNATPTAIEKVNATVVAQAYNINGQRVAANEAGLNVVNGHVVFNAK